MVCWQQKYLETLLSNLWLEGTFCVTNQKKGIDYVKNNELLRSFVSARRPWFEPILSFMNPCCSTKNILVIINTKHFTGWINKPFCNSGCKWHLLQRRVLTQTCRTNYKVNTLLLLLILAATIVLFFKLCVFHIKSFTTVAILKQTCLGLAYDIWSDIDQGPLSHIF